MAAINSPVLPSIPLDIRGELPNQYTPWQVSQELFDGLLPVPNAQYKKVQVLPNNQEWRFIWRYFHHLKPLHYSIKRVHFIRERNQQVAFEANISSIENEAGKFPPTWNQESRAPQRARVIQRWKEAAQIFSPFKTKEADGRTHTWTKTKVIPLWHGTNAAICNSIGNSGFVYFGKQIIRGDAGPIPQNTADGYFGSGIYFTNSARYAADIYSDGHLLLGWVSMREPFPFVGDPDQTDMATLRGRGAHKTYNAHYAPVAPIDPGDPDCSEYHPVQANQPPACDEYVVFQKSQTLPQYWVELEVDLPYIRVPRQNPQLVSELIPHLLRILQNPQVDGDQKLRNFLGQQLSTLLKLPPDDDIPAEQAALYGEITRLITPQGSLDREIRNEMVGVVPPQPLPPDYWNVLMTVQRDWQALEFASPQHRGNREIVLAAVKQDGRALQFASEQLKNDKELVLASNGLVLKYASEQLFNDREFIIKAARLTYFALFYASERLKNDRVVVLAAVNGCAWAFEFASEQLRNDRVFVLAVVQQDGSALEFASEQLRNDREIVLAAVQNNPSAIEFASNRLKKDKAIKRASRKNDCIQC